MFILKKKKKFQSYLNIIVLYDLLPKYIWKKNKKKIYDFFLKKYLYINNKKIILKIIPAVINNFLFKKKIIFPGQREEIIEDVLRKFAVHGDFYIIDGKLGVKFSLYNLYKELKKVGHEYNFYEIKESIQICRKSIIAFINKKKKRNYYLFNKIRLLKKYSIKKSKCYVQFNSLVHKHIINFYFKKYNYKLSTSISSPLARYIYKKMSYYWIQKKINTPYTFNLINFLNFSSRKLSKRMSENIRSIKNALNILINKKIIKNYFFIHKKKKKKILDTKYIIYPNIKFIKQIIITNKFFIKKYFY